jgi:uncharacterized membrane protein
MTEAFTTITREAAILFGIGWMILGFLIIFISVFLYIKFKKSFQKEFERDRSELEEAGLAFAGYNTMSFFVGFVTLGTAVYLIGAGYYLYWALSYDPGVKFLIVLSPFFLFIIGLKLFAQKMEGKPISDLWKGDPN